MHGLLHQCIYLKKCQVLRPKGWLRKYTSITFTKRHLWTKLWQNEGVTRLRKDVVHMRLLWRCVSRFISNKTKVWLTYTWIWCIWVSPKIYYRINKGKFWIYIGCLFTTKGRRNNALTIKQTLVEWDLRKPTCKKEIMEVTLSIQCWRIYLLERKFTICSN